MGPPAFNDGRALRELFERPDEWRETRSLVDVVLYADLQFKKQFTDDELRAWLRENHPGREPGGDEAAFLAR